MLTEFVKGLTAVTTYLSAWLNFGSDILRLLSVGNFSPMKEILKHWQANWKYLWHFF
jgi:hypothetical protein